jgi:hypothetical protein
MTNRTKLRREMKIRFVVLHLELFKRHEKEQLLYPERFKTNCPTTETAIEIVEHARNKIGYSKATNDCDILGTLYIIYNKIMQCSWKRFV